MQPHQLDRAARAIEDSFAVDKEGPALLRLIDAEFQSDPTSTHCLDARIVARARECVARRSRVQEHLPFYVVDDEV